jgi:crossover junction endodeoxyribonuclease RuvC
LLVLGIDPGTAITGYGLVEEKEGDFRLVNCGVVSTPAGMSLEKRLLLLYEQLSDIIARYHPEEMAVEEVFFGKNVTTAIAVSHGRGIALLAAAQNGIPVFSYKPAEIKQSVVGYGNADKHQMQAMIKMLLGLDEVPKPDDAADAVAVAICHIQRNRYKSLVGA